MCVFFFFETMGAPPIDHIKDCLKEIYLLGESVSAPINNTDKRLAERIQYLSYHMFCYNKQNKKTFTVCNNSKLRNMRIQEDADGFSEADSLVINTFLNDNLLEAFSELIAYTYLCANDKDYSSRLFVGKFYSRYSNSDHFVFFVNKKEDIYIFDEELLEIKLSDYISNYFSATGSPDTEIENIYDIIFSKKSFSEKLKEIFTTIKAFNTSVCDKHEFVFGAITFLDFLAWKGLWQSQNEDTSLNDVSNLIEDFREKLKVLTQEYFPNAKGIPLSSLISISDTIAVFTPKTSTVEIHSLLKLHAHFSKYVLEQCCLKTYPIRGAISYGEYSTMKNIMIGPGIDECASWHEMGNWIGVHLTPTAQIYWDDDTTDDIIIGYNVPTKVAAKVSNCVKWGIPKESFKQLALKSRALLPSIADKYTNTQNFLKEHFWKEDNDDG